MTEENKGGDAINLDTIKQAIAEQNRQFGEGLKNEVKSIMAESFKKVPEPSSYVPNDFASDEDYEEVKSEISELGLEEKEAKALVAAVNKLVAKKTPKLQETIEASVNQTQDAKEIKRLAELDVMTKYPDCVNKNSPLYRRASEIFAEEFDANEVKSPRAMAKAVRMAAGELGIRPVDLAEIRARDAENPTGGGAGGNSKKKGEVSEKQMDFAKAFGVNPDKFKAQLKAG